MKNAVALGTFDGVHKGHRAVLDLPCGYKKTVVTFSLPPKAVLTGQAVLITTTDDKIRILKSLGIDEILMLDFKEIKDMSSESFLDFLKEKYNPKMISCGYNYRFGKNGSGNTDTLKDFCIKNSIELKITDSVKAEGEVISSTLIRELLANAKIKEANKLLSEPFSFEGIVLEGDKRGRTIGFPTVNVKYPTELVRLKQGVYKTKISFDGKSYYGITDIGIRPTYKLNFITSETYIKGFSGNLYGEKIRITPLEFLRSEIKFNSLEELKKQIETDINSI